MPTEITSWAEFAAISSGLSGDYILMNDLGTGDTGYDTYASSSANGGAGWAPLGNYSSRFSGTFDGGGYVVTGIYMNRNTQNGIGIFGTLNGGGVIKNVGFTSVDISTSSPTDATGGIAGYMTGGTIQECYITGDVTNSYANGGGVAGTIYSGTITNTYSGVNETSGNRAGGIGGYSEGTVSYCYAYGAINGAATKEGGIIGGNYGTVTECYYDEDTTGQSDTGKGVPLSTAEMQDIDSFSAWDIVAIGSYVDETWYIDDGNDYPRLGWEYEAGGTSYGVAESDSLSLSDSVSIDSITLKNISGSDTLTLTDSVYTERIDNGVEEKHIIENLNLSDTIYLEADIINSKALSDTLNFSDSVSIEADVSSSKALSDTLTLTDTISIRKSGASGSVNKDTFWVNNNGDWVEFNHFDYFKVKKRQNQLSEFEIKIYDISTAEKAYFKEQAEVLFFAGETMILKGRIQKIEYASSYEVIATGYGMESLLLDKQFISSGDNRVQYTNESAQTIANAINDSILTTTSDGLWADDYGNVSLRFEYANRLNSLGKLAESIDYKWWVSQTNSDQYSTNYLHLASNQGETSSQKTFNLSDNMIESSQEKDLNNMVNYVHVLGYGDGVNQISTSCYAASTQSSVLALNITSTDSSIPVADGSVFDATGSVRIAKEQVSYSGISANTLTGCTRGYNSTTAKSHNKNCYLEQHYTTTSAQTGSSIQTYGLMDYTLIDKTIIDEDTLEVVGSKYLLDHKTPVLRIQFTSDEPLTDAALNIGDNVTLTDSESDIDGSYRIVSQDYNSNYGILSLTTEVSNRSLEFIEQMNKSKQAQDELAKYMQGATNIYAISEAENCDDSHYLNMRFFVPNEAVSINKVLLNFKLKDYRVYSTSTNNTGDHTHTITGATSATAEGGEYINENIFIFEPGTTYDNTILFSGNVVPDSPTGTFAGAIVTVTWFNQSNTNSSSDIEVEIYNATHYHTIGSQGGLDCDGGETKSVNFVFDTDDVSVNDLLKVYVTNWHGGTVAGAIMEGYIKCTIQSLSTHTHSVSGQTAESDGAHSHDITYGISEESLTSPSVDVYIGEDGGSLSLKDTYTSDQTEIDITDEVAAVGAGNWVDIQFRPNKNMRIETNAYVQIFIESK